MTFTNSEDAIEANMAICYNTAAREIKRHGQQCRPALSSGMIEVLDVEYRQGAEPKETWVLIQCTTRHVLAWLGY